MGRTARLVLGGPVYAALAVAAALVALVSSIYWVADGMHGGEIRGCPG